jgi:hypothetical protein
MLKLNQVKGDPLYNLWEFNQLYIDTWQNKNGKIGNIKEWMALDNLIIPSIAFV